MGIGFIRVLGVWLKGYWVFGFIRVLGVWLKGYWVFGL